MKSAAADEVTEYLLSIGRTVVTVTPSGVVRRRRVSRGTLQLDVFETITTGLNVSSCAADGRR